ncbi:hypothetical protein ATANTOWER_020561 [Ataeniobius toweri]|uniref:Uncharacterized protein n=1 Tax=Ataeniobius toweri TaxID=208326 RepID=A0ABU7C319_9TELE|nr:hypothetical protein [Ataeniobius toweri]
MKLILIYASVTDDRRHPRSTLLSELCGPHNSSQFKLKLHGASEETWLPMTKQRRADDGDPAYEKRRNRCSGRSGRGFSILGWSETVWTEHLITTINGSQQLRRRARVTTQRSLVGLNKHQEELMQKARTLKEQR